MARLLFAPEAELQDTPREQNGGRQGSSKTSGEPQQKQWWPVHQPDAESRGRGSRLGSTVRLRGLLERPARQSEQATAVAEQPIKSHYGPTEIDIFSLLLGSNVLRVRGPRTMSPGRYLTETDAAVFAIGIVLKELHSSFFKTSNRNAEVVTKLRLALVEIQNPHYWVLSRITDAKVQAKRAKWKMSRRGSLDMASKQRH